MLIVLQILTVVIVSVVLTGALAHALELPGKLRLSRDEYFVVQRIYYPGFTFAGISEPVSFLLVLVLLFLVPRETMSFWLTLGALVGLMGVQLVYWVLVHPLNTVWLQKEKLGRAGSSFFGSQAQTESGDTSEWQKLRNRWEYSHVARAALAMVSFIALVSAGFISR
jgi:hypothetical protein